MTYFRKRRNAFGYALRGLKAFFTWEDHPKIHAVAAITALAMGFGFSISTMEWIAVIICIGMVISLEAVNSAIEQLTDIASPDYLEAAGKVKDIAAAAVLVASIAAAATGLIIFIPKILDALA